MEAKMASELKPLWGGKKLPVVGVTGELGSGKTILLLTIDPDCFDRSAAPRTIVWDTEKSSEPFKDSLWFEHRPLTDVMVRPGYKPEHLYLEWLSQMRAVEPGRFRVGCIDTVSEIEDGLANWVRQHPEQFSHTKGQYARMEGLFWGDVKSLWKQHLSEAAARFETFGFSSHTKLVWRGSEPTTEKTAKGKQTLLELASLYLWLDRTPKARAKTAPQKPSGIIFRGKNRLVRLDAKTNELHPILPPRLPEATPDAIRAYIAEPADYSNLKPGERLEGDKPLSDDERLMVQSSIARDQAVTAQADLSRVEMMRQAAAAQAGQMGTYTVVGSVPAAEPAAPAPALQLPGATQQPPAAPAAPPAPAADPATSAPTNAPGTITPEQREEIIGLFQRLDINPPDAQTIIGQPKRGGCRKLAEMSHQAAGELIGKLKVKFVEQEIAQGLEGSDEPPFDTTGQPS